MWSSILELASRMPGEVWRTLTAMAPYLLFGFLVAGVLSVFISPETVERHLGGRGRFWPALKAAAFGVPLPLCSCGVIPVAASLRRHGAGRGAATSFLLSTPQTGVDSILVTYSMLGPVFAIVRPVAALLSGLVGGTIVGSVEAADAVNGRAETKCEDACCARDGRGKLARVFHYGFVTLPRDLWRALVVGIVIAGVIAAVVPEGFFADYLGGGGFWAQLGAMLVMMIIGLPIYVCATASVPLALAFIHMGVSPGAALVFLMTGPATNAATVATVWKTMGRRTTLIYLATVAVTALGSGLALNYWVDVIGAGTNGAMLEHAGHGLLPAWVGIVAAVGLVGVLVRAAFAREVCDLPALDVRGDVITLTVAGMHCSHCVNSITRGLKEVQGVSEASVSLETGLATVRGDGLDKEALKRKVVELGYEVTGIEESPGPGKGEAADGHQGHAH
ncbi:MAG: SO_0444 family Cu/Zn efflux transporter [Planctomycetota bacterium]|jgi:uncharacterized membrane protein YraQ (UPF0718 family)/copper chaperone CopZ